MNILIKITCCLLLGPTLILSSTRSIISNEETDTLTNCVTETSKSWFTTQDFIVFILQVTDYMYEEKEDYSKYGFFSSHTEIIKNPKHHFCSEGDVTVNLYKYTSGETEHEANKLKSISTNLTGVEDEILRKLFGLGRWSVIVSPVSYTEVYNLIHMENHIILLSYSNGDNIMSLRMKLQKHFQLLILHGLNKNGRYIVVLVGKDISESLVLHVLSQISGHNILNVVVLVQNRSEPAVNLYKAELNIRYPEATVLLDTCLSRKHGVAFKDNSTQYPDHTTVDLRKHCFYPESDNEPFITYGEEGVVGGLDLRIAQHFAQYVNANGSCTDQTREQQITLVNTLYTYINPQYLAAKLDPFVSHYYTVRYTFFVPVAESYPRWTTLTRVFSSFTWMCIFLYLLLNSVLLRIFTRPEDPKRTTCECLLYAWSTILAIGVDQPKSTALRFFFFSSILCSLSFSTVFQSFFMSYLVNPGLEHQIDSLKDLEEANCSLIFDSVRTLRRFVPYNRLENQSYFLYQDHAFLYALNTPKSAIFTHDDIFTYITKKMCHGVEIIYHKFTEDVMQFHIGLTSADYPILQDRLNKFLRRIVEGGIPDKIMADITDPIGLRKAALKGTDLSGEYVQMTLQHLQSPFYFWLLGLGITLFIFVIEVLLKCKVSGISVSANQ